MAPQRSSSQMLLRQSKPTPGALTALQRWRRCRRRLRRSGQVCLRAPWCDTPSLPHLLAAPHLTLPKQPRRVLKRSLCGSPLVPLHSNLAGRKREVLVQGVLVHHRTFGWRVDGHCTGAQGQC